MSRLLRQLGITALYVTHADMNRAVSRPDCLFIRGPRGRYPRRYANLRGSCMNTVMTVKKGVVLAMALSAMMLSSAMPLTVYTAGPGSLAKSLASGFEQQTGVKVTVFRPPPAK